MAELNFSLDRAASALRRYRGLLLPIGAAGLVFAILVPLPPLLMDVLLLANIALAALILLTCIHVSSPLDFSVFPSVLLGATLLRLVLNVATTRLILTSGSGGYGPQAAHLDAGQVIWTFGHFVTSGSLAVGVIIFAILVAIQFIVVTKGAGRISEVAARFVLDALPGKQMAIDADLNAGLIDETEARRRRREVAREADFYGAMDGASKFLRGDALAAVLITMVNIGGGLYVGLVQRGWTWRETMDLFTRLTIGDGLVTQIPAFIVSVSAALLVTRSTSRTNLGEEVLSQLASRPTVLIITAAFLAALTLTSLPAAPLLILGFGCVGLAWMLSRRGEGESDGDSIRMRDGDEESTGASQREPGFEADAVPGVDALRIDVGYSLVRLVDAEQDGDLLERIARLRRQMAGELGFVVPPVRVRDDMRLDAHAYVVRLRGAKVGEGTIYPKQHLAISEGEPSGRLIGRETVEPAFGTPAVWIDPAQSVQAERMGYTVVDPAAVVMTHLGELVRTHAADLLSRQQVADMLGRLEQRCGELVRDVRERFRLSAIHRVLQSLLRERVAIVDAEAILEAIDDFPGDPADVESLGEHVRASMSRSLCQQYCAPDGKLWCVALDERLEETLADALTPTARGSALAVEPELASRIARAVDEQLGRLRADGRRPVMLVPPQLRAPLRNLVSAAVPDAAVLSYSEIDSGRVRTISSVGIEA